MVRSIKWALGLGFLLWVIPFVISMVIFPIKSSDVQLFDSILAVVTVLFVTIFGIVYFMRMDTGYLREGVVIGILWLGISIVIDLLMFSRGPMAMPFLEYIKDIGLGYLVYPIVTTGLGYLMEKRKC